MLRLNLLLQSIQVLVLHIVVHKTQYAFAITKIGQFSALFLYFMNIPTIFGSKSNSLISLKRLLERGLNSSASHLWTNLILTPTASANFCCVKLLANLCALINAPNFVPSAALIRVNSQFIIEVIS